jgi:hypothetical protein
MIRGFETQKFFYLHPPCYYSSKGCFPEEISAARGAEKAFDHGWHG